MRTTEISVVVFLAAWAAAAQVPDFVHGEECLFCHRNNIGISWQKNAHGQDVRPNSANDEFVLGSRGRTRRLRKDGYGKFAIWDDGAGKWDRVKFAAKCAGCHATAVDPKDRTFAYSGLDCYTCHGVVDLKHSGDTALVLLSKKRRDPAKVVLSICGSCHLRGGSSRSSGSPYPLGFIPGSNLFFDFEAPFDRVEDRHVARAVQQESSCLACHVVHSGSTEKHRRVLSSAICDDCHFAGRPRRQVRPRTAHSATCEY